MIEALFTRAVTVLHSGEGLDLDQYGNSVATVELAQDTVGELQQRMRNESEGTVGTEDFLLLLPPHVSVDTNDRVEVDGQAYEVIGPTWNVRNPRTGRDHHIECTLRRNA